MLRLLLSALMAACAREAALREPGADAAVDGDTGDADSAPGTDADPCPLRCGPTCAGGDDPRHCGDCDRRCAAFERCRDAVCGCDADEPLCGTEGRARWPLTGGLRTPRGEGTVHDSTTDLLWQRGVSPTRLTVAQAAAYCASLGLAGRNDWRMPGRMELVTILDGTRTPSIDPIFDATPADYHWTQSRPGHRTDRAYSIYFGGGETVTADVNVAGAYVRCVATDAAGAVPPLTPDERTVVDAATGLRWDRSTDENRTHAQATAICGGKGMRLPTLREVQSLVDEASEPAIDRRLFPDTPADARLWTATTRDLGLVLAWTLHVATGRTELEEIDALADVQCVTELR